MWCVALIIKPLKLTSTETSSVDIVSIVSAYDIGIFKGFSGFNPLNKHDHVMKA